MPVAKHPSETPRPTLRVVRETASPPGGWNCRVPETETVFSNPNFSQLAEVVRAHLSKHGLDPADAESRIHETTAKRLVAQGHGKWVKRAEPIKRTVRQYAAGVVARTLLWWKESPLHGLLKGKFDRGESPFVDQAEADRRAAICVICEKNAIPTGKGWAQNWTDRKMLDCIAGKMTASHDDLGICSVCTCELRASVWWPADILKIVTPKSDIPKHPEICWKRKILEA